MARELGLKKGGLRGSRGSCGGLCLVLPNALFALACEMGNDSQLALDQHRAVRGDASRAPSRQEGSRIGSADFDPSGL